MDTKQYNQPKQQPFSNHKLVEIYASPQTISSQNKIVQHDKIGLGVNAETALQLALQFVDTTKELMWYYDTNYRYLAANQAYCDTFQCEINDITDKHCVEVITEETFNAIKSSLDKCLQGKDVHREF